MPPRYAYWTIIVDDQPTAFRSGSQEELMPTFNRLKAKNATAVMMWFQNGKLWPSRVDAQEMMHARGEMGRRGDEKQAGRGSFREGGAGSSFRGRDPERKPSQSRERSAWTPRGEPSTPAPARNADAKLDWKPKGDFVPAPKRADRAASFDRESKPDWKSKASKPQSFKASDKPEWKPKGAFTPAPRRSEKPDWKPKGSFDREAKPDWKSKPSSPRAFKPSGSEDRPRSFKRPDFKPSGDDTRSAKPEWKPKGSFVPAPKRSENRDWSSKPSSSQAFKPSRSEKPEWKPKGSFDRESKPDWKSKPSSPRAFTPSRSEKPAWRPNRDSDGRFSSSDRERAPRTEKPEWKPKGSFTPTPRRPRPDWDSKPSSPQAFKPSGEKRKWVPKEEYKKSMGIEAKRDSKWRPGGEHKDPRQKYKDAKKAKWTKFKKDIRARSGGKGKKSS